MDNDEVVQKLNELLEKLNVAMAQSGGRETPEVKAAQQELNLFSKNTKMSAGAAADAAKKLGKGSGVTSAAGEAANGLKKMAIGTVNVGVEFLKAGNAVRDSREDFTSLNPAINMVGDAMSMTGKTIGMALDAIGSAIPGGGIISGVGKFGAAIAEAAGQITKTVGTMLTADLQRASEAYRAAGQVGALGAEGLTGLGNQAIQAGLSFSDFANVVKDNAHGLAFAFGDAATGAQKLADTGEAMAPFQRELLGMGVSVKQQNEMTAEYLKLQARTGRIETMSARELAAGSKNYITQLTALSRLTGKSVDEQQKELDNQMRNVRMAAAVSDVQAQYGPKAANAMRMTAAAISGIDEDIGKGLQDALAGNLGTQAAQEFQLAAGEMGAQAVDLLRKGAISTEQATAMISEGVKKQAEALGGPQTIGAVAGLGTAFDNVLPGMLKFQNRVNLTADEIAKLAEQQKTVGKTTDGTTKAMVDAQQSMIRSAQALDKLALQTTLPLAATAIDSFTAGMKTATQRLAQYAGKDMEEIGAMLKEDANKAIDAVADSDTGSRIAGAIGGSLAGAGIGATIGSFIAPGIGTAIGGAIGTIVGGISGAFLPEIESAVDGVSNWFSGLFGGKRALGGPVNPGMFYTVGENGPETLVPNERGTVLNKQQIGAMAKSVGLDASMAGPKQTYQSSGISSFIDSIADGISNLASPAIDAVTGPGKDEMLLEAAVGRLDMISQTLSRQLDTSEKLLQATHR